MYVCTYVYFCVIFCVCNFVVINDDNNYSSNAELLIPPLREKVTNWNENFTVLQYVGGAVRSITVVLQINSICCEPNII